ncbi:MAG: fructose-bisphosphate aldolase class I [Candidatus Pacebacteria bacterium]|nr:fructose-bisphosphate aldolase class I [Candidatus Paceibacterota bacterium]
MDTQKLQATARAMVAKGKGILAADESNATCHKRFATVGVPETEEMRRAYRELLLTAEGNEKYLSGVILFDETLRQSTADGIPFAKILIDRGIIPGIKVDKGPVPFACHDGEVITQGLDGLRERFAEYAALGAGFAKWRAVITIDTAKNLPSDECMRANAGLLAMYALYAQEAGIVPMLEPEVILDGVHTIDTSAEVTGRAIKILFEEMMRYGVYLPGVVLKTSMVVPGSKSGQAMNADEVGDRTSRVLLANVPESIGGVVFLSGGQTPLDSTKNLNAIAKKGPYPWGLTYSFSRGIQEPVLSLWKGDSSKTSDAQKVFLERLKDSSDASLGEYLPK